MLAELQKETISLRYWLLGKGYWEAVRAMEFAREYHTGLRKDQKTPEFAHQIQIVNYLRTLHPGLLHPGPTYATGFLHDLPEDYDVDLDVIEARYGRSVRQATWLLTKQYRGEAREMEEYFGAMAEDPIASVVKGADRIHNFQSMPGVFSEEKQHRYLEEWERYILPMLKRARRNYPEQESVYENIKLVSESQAALIRLSLRHGNGQ